MYSVQINQLNKSFGSKKILDNLSITMNFNAIIAVVGNNGVGKSVFLNCLLDFIEYDSGEILIFERNHNDHNFLRTNTAFISVDNQLHLHKVTPLEYFELIILIYNLSNQETKRKAYQLAEELNIISELNSSFDSLSFGTKKKVQLIGSILYNPKLLVCDEIFEGLDFEAVTWVKKYFLERKANGLATLFTSHIKEYIEEIADEVYRLKDKKLHLEKVKSYN